MNAPHVVAADASSPPSRFADANPRIDGLDGLRAVSILFVLVGHGAHTAGAPAFLHVLGEMGIVGVEIFFTISGFIITHLLLREHARDGRVDLRKFWMRRALRIVPPFCAAALAIAVAAASGVLQWHWPSFIGAVTLTKDTPLLPGDWFFGHIWSLSLEEQFYLIWPLVFALALDRRRTMIALALIVLGSVLATPLTVACAKGLQNIVPYVPHLAAGCLLAIALHAPREPRWLRRYRTLPARGTVLAALAIVALAVAWLRGRDLQDLRWLPLYAVLVPVTALLIVAEIALPDGRLRKVLALAPLRWLGRISYSLYLWQQLFLGPTDAYPHPWLWSSWPFNLFAAIACGALGYYLVEKPSARLKRRFERRAASTSARGEPARLGHDSMSCPVLANAPPRMAGRGRDRE
ncbi:MAG TPA: acyltransferase [Solimonas sp.]|nr:acyltransferase [Solimonas sp.]